MPLLYRLCSPWGGAPGCSWGTSRGKVSAPAVTSPPTPTSPSPQHWVPGPAEGFRRSCSQAPTCAPWKPEDLAPHALRNPLHFQGPPTWPSPHSQAEHPNTTPQTPPHSLHLASCPCPGEHTYRPQLSCSRLDAAPLGGGECIRAAEAASTLLHQTQAPNGPATALHTIHTDPQTGRLFDVSNKLISRSHFSLVFISRLDPDSLILCTEVHTQDLPS